MSQTIIEWTEPTSNPTTGCSVMSPGCHRSYARTMAVRLKGMTLARIAAGKDPKRFCHLPDVVGIDTAGIRPASPSPNKRKARPPR